MKKIAILSLLLLLNACGATAPAFLATSAGTYSEYKVMSIIKTGADFTLSLADLPTTNDMVLSRITGYECKVSRALKEGIEYICKDVKIHPPTNTTIDNDEKK
tara:strand:- start:700 stop:1008 length:309 start_codon:yes stop_codon:yes gene_type:complete